MQPSLPDPLEPWKPLAIFEPQSDSGALLPLLSLTPHPLPCFTLWAYLALWGLRKPWEPSAALEPQPESGPCSLVSRPPWLPWPFGALGSLQQFWSLRLWGLAPLASLAPWGLWNHGSLWQSWASVRLGGLDPPHSEASLGPLEPGTLLPSPSGASGSLWQSWDLGHSGVLLPLGLPGTSGASESLQQSLGLRLRGFAPLAPLRKPWKPLAVLGPQSDSGVLLPIPLTPRPPWSLRKPWKPWQSWGISQTQGPCWWLITHLSGWFAVFAPKFWAGGGDLQRPFATL